MMIMMLLLIPIIATIKLVMIFRFTTMFIIMMSQLLHFMIIAHSWLIIANFVMQCSIKGAEI